MKFFRLLLKNLFRNKLRTALTVSSIAASIFLVAVLISLLDGLTNPPETPDSALRLITRHKISLFNSLPVGHREKIASVEGVEAVIGSMWFGGMYDNKGVDQMLAQFAVDTDQFFIVEADMKIPNDQKEASYRTGLDALWEPSWPIILGGKSVIGFTPGRICGPSNPWS